MAGNASLLRSFSKGLGGIFRISKIPEAPALQIDEGPAVPSTLPEHWAALKAQGFTASQFIDYLQPFADLEGISVSYSYKDDAGHEQVYNHRRDDAGYENPLSRAIREKLLSRERALEFALNEEGRVWIESNFLDLR